MWNLDFKPEFRIFSLGLKCAKFKFQAPKGATRFLCRGNDIRQALARVFAPVGATTNLGRAAHRAGAI